MRSSVKLLGALTVAVLLVAGACANGDDTEAEPTAEPTETEEATEAPTDGDPSVEITSPGDGSTVDGAVTVEIAVENFDVVDKLGEDAVPGEGHIHYFKDIDEADLPTDPDQPMVAGEAGTNYRPVNQESLTWEEVEAGEHTFCAALVDNDHTAIDPAVFDCVTVTVS